MSSGSARPDPEPSRHAAHRHGRDADLAPSPGTDDAAWFAVVLRGYDRSQVESRLAELDRRVHEEIRRAEAAESSLDATRAHVRRLREELEARATATPSAATPATGNADFGHRLERVLQAAEQEAEQLRDKALADAEEIRAAARAEAEEHRLRTEEALLGRAAVLDREFTARSTDLDERERSAVERLESARDEADELRERARTELDRARDEAAELRRDAERTADDRRDGITRDVDRLSALRTEVLAELTRVRERLTAELDREPVAAVPDDDLFGPYPADPADRAQDGPPPPGEPTGLRTDDLGTAEHSGDDAAGTAPDRDPGDDDRATGTLLLGPGRLPDRGPGPRPEDDETTIGRIPPISLASIGVLPFGDLAAGGDSPRTRTDGINGASRGHRGPTRGPGPGRRSR